MATKNHLTYGDLVPGTLCKSRDGSKTYMIMSIVKCPDADKHPVLHKDIDVYNFTYLYIWHGVEGLTPQCVVDKPQPRAAVYTVKHMEYVYILPVITE